VTKESESIASFVTLCFDRGSWRRSPAAGKHARGCREGHKAVMAIKFDGRLVLGVNQQSEISLLGAQRPLGGVPQE